MKFDSYRLKTAVKLAKTDLTTELVKEFTELQGVIGGLYARAQGLGETVACAIYDQYRPASTEDAIPSTVEGQVLGLADRIQTITAMFGIGNAPTGSKDPFALRRAANAIVKILAESKLQLTLAEVVEAGGAEGSNRDLVTAFLRERLHFYLKDVCGFAYDVVNADGRTRVGRLCCDLGGIQADQEHSAAARGKTVCARVPEGCDAVGGGAEAGGLGSRAGAGSGFAAAGALVRRGAGADCHAATGGGRVL